MEAANHLQIGSHEHGHHLDWSCGHAIDYCGPVLQLIMEMIGMSRPCPPINESLKRTSVLLFTMLKYRSDLWSKEAMRPSNTCWAIIWRIKKMSDQVESSSSTAVIALVVAIVAIAVVVMLFWQPWVAQPASSSTTVIHDTQTTPAASSPPVIVNPPAAAPGNTKIDIHNDVPKSDPPTNGGATGAGNTP